MWFSLYRWKGGGVKSRTSAFSGVKRRTLRQSATFYPQWITVQFVSKHGGKKSGGKKTGAKSRGVKRRGVKSRVTNHATLIQSSDPWNQVFIFVTCCIFVISGSSYPGSWYYQSNDFILKYPVAYCQRQCYLLSTSCWPVKKDGRPLTTLRLVTSSVIYQTKPLSCTHSIKFFSIIKPLLLVHGSDDWIRVAWLVTRLFTPRLFTPRLFAPRLFTPWLFTPQN